MLGLLWTELRSALKKTDEAGNTLLVTRGIERPHHDRDRAGLKTALAGSWRIPEHRHVEVL